MRGTRVREWRLQLAFRNHSNQFIFEATNDSVRPISRFLENPTFCLFWKSVHFTSGVPPSRSRSGRISEKEGGTARGGHLEPLWDPILDQNPFRKHQKVHFFAPAALLIYRFPFENPPKSQNFRPPEADFCRKPL